ncbi:hypothetical protein E6O75_ATG10340 [Venturia nashicola]|uniref:Uncharacterized protein n=1 Tax=Venturia nashicola TaxID=86259 RepID=A0A4Z1NBQ9_9PEZI|nr:hypothetical protein E6O75_ATG10340 [Venturia nashicola]
MDKPCYTLLITRFTTSALVWPWLALVGLGLPWPALVLPLQRMQHAALVGSASCSMPVQNLAQTADSLADDVVLTAILVSKQGDLSSLQHLPFLSSLQHPLATHDLAKSTLSDS